MANCFDIPPAPFESWVFNEEVCEWRPPTPYPGDEDNMYVWIESPPSWLRIGPGLVRSINE